MKRILYILLVLVLPVIVSAQSNATHKNVKVTQKSKLIGQVVIGATSFDASAILTVTSSTKGALMPRMNTAARDAIGSPADGLLIYNNQTNQYEFFEATWQAVGGGADGNGIYDGSGSLSNNPTIVTQGANKLQFTSAIIDGFSVDGTTFSIDASNNRVGIGTATPGAVLDIKANSNNDGIFLRSSSGALQVVLQAHTADGGKFKLENAASSLNIVQFNHSNPDFFNTGNDLAVGVTSAATSRFLSKGANATSANYAIRAHDSGGSLLLGARNDGAVEINASGAFYLGDPDTDGTWRIIRSGDDLLMQQREAGTYNTKQTISGA